MWLRLSDQRSQKWLPESRRHNCDHIIIYWVSLDLLKYGAGFIYPIVSRCENGVLLFTWRFHKHINKSCKYYYNTETEDRQTDRQLDRWMDRQTDWQSGQGDREIREERDGEMDGWMDRQTDWMTEGGRERQRRKVEFHNSHYCWNTLFTLHKS